MTVIADRDCKQRFHALFNGIFLTVEGARRCIDNIVAVFCKGDVRLNSLFIATVPVGAGEYSGRFLVFMRPDPFGIAVMVQSGVRHEGLSLHRRDLFGGQRSGVNHVVLVDECLAVGTVPPPTSHPPPIPAPYMPPFAVISDRLLILIVHAGFGDFLPVPMPAA